MSGGDLESTFRRVASERIETLRATLKTWRQEPLESSRWETLLREVHTLKGEARILGFESVHLLARKAEELLQLGERSGGRASNNVAEVLDWCVRALRAKVAGSEPPNELELLDFTFQVDAVLAEPETAQIALPELEEARANVPGAGGLGDEAATEPLGRTAGSIAVLLAEVAEETEDFASALGVPCRVDLTCESGRWPALLRDRWRVGLTRFFRRLVRLTADEERGKEAPAELRLSLRLEDDSTIAVDTGSSHAGWRGAFGSGTEEEDLGVTSSEADEGYHFRLRAQGADEAGETSGEPGSAAEVLIVDDSPITRSLLVRLVGEMGLRARQAENGETAWQLLQGWRPRLVLLDLEMPVLDGFQFLGRLRDHGRVREQPVIVFSSRDSAADQERCYDLGADAYFVKTDYRAADMRLLIEQRLSQAEQDPSGG